MPCIPTPAATLNNAEPAKLKRRNPKMESPTGSNSPSSGQPETDLQPPAKPGEAVANTQPIRMCRADEVRPHPLNIQLYGAACPDDLVKSVANTGILVPLIVTPDNLVISGHRRLEAAKLAGLHEVPVIERAAASDDELCLLLLECNTGRRKTNEQMIREYREFKRIESAMAAPRRGTRNDLRSDPAGSHGRARDLAAAKVGDFSATTLDLGDKVLAVLDEKQGSENMQTVEEARTLLNEHGFAAAHSRLQILGWMPPGRSKKAGENPANRGSADRGTKTTVQEPEAGVLTAERDEIAKPGDFVARFTTLYKEMLGDAPTPAHAQCVKDAVGEFATSILGTMKGDH